MDLQQLAFSLLGVLGAGYVILDGFDIGVGALSLFARSRSERDLQLASIHPVWGGNQVWLLALSDVLFGGFPGVFGTVMSGLYPALILWLLAFLARAVSIELRAMHAADRWKDVWDRAHGAGCLVAAVLLGTLLGNVLRGVPVGPGFRWQGSPFGSFHPYALLTGGVSASFLLMHGALYLSIRSEGAFSARQSRIALRTYPVFLVLFLAGLGATLILSPLASVRRPGAGQCALGAVLAAVLLVLPAAIRAGWKRAAFLGSSAIVALVVSLIAWAVYPVLVPSSLSPELSLTVRNASSEPATLAAILVIASVGMPIMLGYTFAVYRIFRGPARLPSAGR